MNYVTWKFVPGRRSCHWAQSSGLQRALLAGQESPGLWGLLTAIGPAPEKPHQAVRFIFGSLTVIQQQLHIEWTYYVHFQSHNWLFDNNILVHCVIQMMRQYREIFPTWRHRKLRQLTPSRMESCCHQLVVTETRTCQTRMCPFTLQSPTFAHYYLL